MREFWDSVAMFFGYNRWEWGTAADWVGAIGTAGAFLFGFLIFARDKHRQTRELADRFATWFEEDSDTGTKTLHAHNGADLPVVNATAVLHRAGTLHSRDLPEITRSIKAGSSASIALRGKDAEATSVYIQFTDGASRRWTRDLLTGGYLSRFQRWRLIGRHDRS